MCGICGLVSLKNALPAGTSEAANGMMEAMRHRGPDGEGLWSDGKTCLGHRRLSIIDLAGGRQPMSDITGRYLTVFNGEIYNFQLLRRELENCGIRFQTCCDTEVILGAYAVWGEACLTRLEGMFAFALWDTVTAKLFCARDHFGKKPFYYSVQDGIFAFSSDLNSLATLASWRVHPFSFTPAPVSIMRYLAYEYVPVPESIYSEAKVLQPSCYLMLENGSLSEKRYWSLPMPEQIDIAPCELEEELKLRLDKAVRARMISDVPLGVFLSGGIDSTIITGLMSRASAAPVQAFSIGFTEASYDESHYARIAAKAFGVQQHERILSADACADELPGIIANMDTPMADASCAPTWLLSGLAREHVTVALGGDGADELWAGYEHYIGYKLALLYNRIPAFLRTWVIEPMTRLLPESAGYINPRLAVKTFLAGCHAPDWLRVQTMLTAMGAKMQQGVLSREWLNDTENLLNPDILFASTRRAYEFWQDKARATPLARAFHVYCRQFLLDDILVKVDRLSMLHSLEVRAPFLDKNVAEFAASLPLGWKLHGFRRKYLLKKTFASLLPPEILKRNKRGFQIPVSGWLRGKLKPLLLEVADRDFLKKQGIFSWEGIGRLIQAHLDGKADMRKPLWTFFVFQLWWQAHRKVWEKGDMH